MHEYLSVRSKFLTKEFRLVTDMSYQKKKERYIVNGACKLKMI